ncbi:MAG: peptidase M50 [Chloroflexi bacterium AL-W]|nr:peptidase M50 [Chloroflexi bacterium AL-N1]NOK65711.1 peptidase M50 [Chloroflexi bacterium AL-N10]NOK74348.1 peptidase M50 [Chloroflexi bacterium AL-N5]NOK80744.1 peptidase M50 [Chloroflexi bacterium AL-W]NOK88606.1 peptidase M50 [Chloroflexi bacterium AL-N15]
MKEGAVVRGLFTTPDESVFQGQSNDNVELLKMWIGSTLAFAVFSSGGAIQSPAFVTNLIIASIVCGLAFVLHELAHRIVARGYGAEAHFVANNGMLMISVLIAFAGVFIAAPGAVWHRGYLTKQQSGLVALAGPATNMVLAVIFFFIILGIFVSRLPVPDWLFDLLWAGFRFNGFLGVFNMIPAGPFDGAKVLAWSPVVFGITAAIGIFLAFILTNQNVLSAILGFVSP